MTNPKRTLTAQEVEAIVEAIAKELPNQESFLFKLDNVGHFVYKPKDISKAIRTALSSLELKEQGKVKETEYPCAVTMDWKIKIHRNDLSKVMKPEDCRFIGTVNECADFIKEHFTRPAEDAKGEWISVSDRLPEADGEYLTYRTDNDVMRVLYFEFGTWGYLATVRETVTHWQALPSPPSTDNTKN